MSVPCPNGSIYAFARDINVIWRHGILQVPYLCYAVRALLKIMKVAPEEKVEQGRISIIAWGWAEQQEV